MTPHPERLTIPYALRSISPYDLVNIETLIDGMEVHPRDIAHLLAAMEAALPRATVSEARSVIDMLIEDVSHETPDILIHYDSRKREHSAICDNCGQFASVQDPGASDEDVDIEDLRNQMNIIERLASDHDCSDYRKSEGP